MGQTDEKHIRDALRLIHSLLANQLNLGRYSVRGDDLDQLLGHIEAIRVKGDSKRQSPTAETGDPIRDAIDQFNREDR